MMMATTLDEPTKGISAGAKKRGMNAFCGKNLKKFVLKKNRRPIDPSKFNERN